MVVRTGNDSSEAPEAPSGWVYWYTYYWDTNWAHTLRAHGRYLLYLDERGNEIGRVRPGEETTIHVERVPAKLFVYRKLLVPATEEDVRDPNRFAQLTRPDPKSEQV